MAVQQKSRAVDVALAHTEAWSNHGFDTARSMLADGVEVTATTTQPIMPATKLAGIDDYERRVRRSTARARSRRFRGDGSAS